ncbi:MAG TPA: hypothetical protein VGI10_02505 [Polyangiaceae bacterium]|jgi:hypothetical protein
MVIVNFWRFGCACLLALLACLPKQARAEAPAQPFRLEYWAHGNCPDAEEFALQLRARAPALRPAVGAEPAVGFYAELAEGHGSAYGRLTARTLDGREITRDVGGPTCDDVVTALALIAALSLEPNEAQVPVSKRPRPPPAEHLPADEFTLPKPGASAVTYGVGLGVAFESLVAPSPSTGVFFDFEAEGPPESLQPLFILSANRATSLPALTKAGNLSVTWLAVRSAGCPVRWPQGVPLFLRPCGFFEIGSLDGRVDSPGAEGGGTKLWLAAGVYARIEALVGEVLAFGLDGGASVPLIRDSFSNAAGQLAYRLPLYGVTGRLGLSYRFK